MIWPVFTALLASANAADPITYQTDVTPDNAGFYGVEGAGDVASIATFTAKQTTALGAQMDCHALYVNTSGCSIDMYLGIELPADANKEKNLLLSFTRDNYAGYKTSRVRAPAVTFYFPPRCDGKVACYGQNLIKDVYLDENSMGFFMFPAGAYPSTYTAAYTWTSAAKVSIEVVWAEPGSSGNLTVKAGAETKVFTQKTANSGKVQGVGNGLEVDWCPSDDSKSGFLARYFTGYEQPQPEATTKSAMALAGSLLIPLLTLRYF
ncbi:unnamed protein product, partial [Mesorhabditis spiculigera]